ncbi:hypothetical protein CMUS01_10148 [Colletotrichum musicola]|uniref:non-specific serine/threonine protein kinase n=1 Tax=Colletotrichum musicola TaxID=2175873 RepID=A0A8H6K5I5_9PEZI|nr:hypothetical protein CMUS01_10148 [Colletotrichum musicola]
MDEEQESADLAIEHLKRHIDGISPDTYAIHVSRDGSLISTSTNPEDDETTCAYYPPLWSLQRPDGIETITRTDLKEIDRLTPHVDLVSYDTSPGVSTGKNSVFKYNMLGLRVPDLWDEMNLWMRLPQHLNIVPFDRVVVDELDGNVIWFTSVYISGGMPNANRSRVFKLKWLEQLTRVIDDLNLKHGIMHQDIAARNILIDPATDDLMLFDFNFSARIGTAGHFSDRDDVKGVTFTLYEIITRDEHFREVPHDSQNPEDIQTMRTWPQHPDSLLDHPVQEYRSFLDRWVKGRQEGTRISVYTEALEPREWPPFPDDPVKQSLFPAKKGGPPRVPIPCWVYIRRIERRKGNTRRFLDWQRPPQGKITVDMSS